MPERVFERFNSWSPYNRPATFVNPEEVGSSDVVDADGLEVLPSGRLVWDRSQYRIPSPRATTVAGAYETYAAGNTQLRGIWEPGGTRNAKTIYTLARADLAWIGGAPRLSWSGARWEITNYDYSVVYYYEDTAAAALPGVTWVTDTAGTAPVPGVVASTFGADVTGLFEFNDGTSVQFLAVTSDGNLYGMNAAWSDVAVQWEYGYGLFDEDWWWLISPSFNTNVCGTHAQGGLYFTYPGAAMLRWDGDQLITVGIAAPEQVPTAGSGTAEDLTGVTYVETDAGTKLTVIAASVTATALSDDDVARVSVDLTATPISDYQHQFAVNLSAIASGAKWTVWAVCNDADADAQTWTAPYIAIAAFYYDATHYSIQLWCPITNVWVSAKDSDGVLAQFALSTPYYVTTTRQGGYLRLYVYSDAGRTVLVGDTKKQVGSSTPATALYFGGATYGAGSAYTGNFTGVASTLDLGNATATGNLAAGSYSLQYTYYTADWESMPSPIADIVVAANSAINWSSITPGPTGTVGRRLYRAYTSDVSLNARGASFGLLHDIEDNTTTTYYDNEPQAYVGEPIGYDFALPPRGGVACAHNSRMWMAGSAEASRSYDEYATGFYANTLFWSEIDAPGYWPGVNFVSVGSAAPIVGIIGVNADLLILKTDSVWVLSGISLETMVLSEVGAGVGCVDGNALAAGIGYVLFSALDGYYLYAGGRVKRILETGDPWPWSSAPVSGLRPTVAFHNNAFYILQTDALLKFDPSRGAWSYKTIGPGSAGIRAISFGVLDAHVLLTMQWVMGGSYEITVLDKLGAGVDRYGAGTVYSDIHAPIAFTTQPLVAQPGELIVPVEVAIEGSWTGTVPKIYVNGDASYSANAWDADPDAPQGGVAIGVPVGYGTTTNAYAKLYVQVKGESAVACDIRRVRVRYYTVAKEGW